MTSTTEGSWYERHVKLLITSTILISSIILIGLSLYIDGVIH